MRESIGMLIFGGMVFIAVVAVLVHEFNERRRSHKSR